MSNRITQFTVKAPEDAKQLFDELFEHQKNERPLLTKGTFLEEIVYAFANPKTVEKEVDNPDLLKANDELAQANCQLIQAKTELNQVIADIRQVLDIKEGVENDVIISLIQATQQRAMTVPATVEVQRPLQENEILFPIPEPHLSLLKETSKRLNASIKDILLDMFFRYTVEQWNEWFYPFVINGKDFENITGHKQITLQKYLKKIDGK